MINQNLGQSGELDLLDSDGFTGTPVESFIDGTESPLAYAFPQPLIIGSVSLVLTNSTQHKTCATYVVFQARILQGPLATIALLPTRGIRGSTGPPIRGGMLTVAGRGAAIGRM